jgi:hypothetical protein
MPAEPIDARLARFEAGLFGGDELSHAEHVRLAFEMLGRHPFDEALARYAAGLRRTTERLGVTGRYHMTITVAFLALVGERRHATGAATWEAFAVAAPELLDRRVLERWYPPDVLASGMARATFVLPPAGR